MLLTALFTSSCYWQPVPTVDILPYPGMTRITINSTSGEEAAINVAGITKLLDRCWCDITSTTSFFDPFNVTRWELSSIRASIPPPIPPPAPEATQANATSNSTQQNNLPGTNSSSPTTRQQPHPFRAIVKGSKLMRLKDIAVIETYERMCSYPSNSLFDQVFCTRYYRFRRAIDSLDSFNDTQVTQAWVDSDWWRNREEKSDADDTPAQVSASQLAQPAQPLPTPARDLPLLRRRYDLRPHGLGLIIDFGWGRSSDDV